MKMISATQTSKSSIRILVSNASTKTEPKHYKVRIHIHGNITVGNYTNAIDAAIAYNKAVDLAHQAGISKNFPENYIEELSASSYADIYQQISLSPKYLSYLKGLPRK